MKEPQKVVAYLRVSTSKQGSNGLGIEAQRTLITDYINQTNSILVSEFVEVESGKKSNRPQLELALSEAKQNKAKLVVAKLDRLSRDVEFIFKLRNNNVDFMALDLPDFNTLTLGIFSSFAQFERERISERIKNALAETKKKGTILGNPQNLTYKDRLKGANTQKLKSKTVEAKKARARALALLKENGDYAITADVMNSEGWTSPRGSKVYPMTVYRWVKKSGV